MRSGCGRAELAKIILRCTIWDIHLYGIRMAADQINPVGESS
jgi:hypothetical protein